MMASLREVPEGQLREWSGAPDATQFFATQTSLAYVIERFLGDENLRKTLESLVEIPDEYEDEDVNKFALELDLGEDDNDKKEQLLNYDLGPQMLYVASVMIRRHTDHVSSVFTPGIYQGESHGRLEDILSGLRKTTAFIEENWPKHVIDAVLKQTIGSYEAANAFLTPSGYLENLRGRKKVTPKISKRHVGTIPYGAFTHTPPIGAALTHKMRYMAPIHMILSYLEGAMTSMGLGDEATMREFEELKDGLLTAASRIDTFVQDKTS
jgi:hypothetical protein